MIDKKRKLERSHFEIEGLGMVDRVYAPDSRLQTSVLLEGDEAHHLGRVRRIEVGEVVEVFDGKGFASRAEVVSVEKRRIALRMAGEPLADRVAPVELTLAVAFPKGDRLDWLVEKATEIGVARLVPILTSRTIVEPRSAKLERLRRTVIEAAKQCGRNRLMEIAEPHSWDAFLARPVDAMRVLAQPGGRAFSTWPNPATKGSAILAIGPEGGFTDTEIDTATALGWLAVSLSSTLLRIETAALVGASRILALAEPNPFKEVAS